MLVGAAGRYNSYARPSSFNLESINKRERKRRNAKLSFLFAVTGL